MENNNYTTKNIKEFTPEDTLYISKYIQGFQYVYLCNNITFKGGIVSGTIISVNPTHRSHIKEPPVITTRIRNCYLWGKPPHSNVESCCWFTKNGSVVDNPELIVKA